MRVALWMLGAQSFADLLFVSKSHGFRASEYFLGRYEGSLATAL